MYEYRQSGKDLQDSRVTERERSEHIQRGLPVLFFFNVLKNSTASNGLKGGRVKMKGTYKKGHNLEEHRLPGDLGVVISGSLFQPAPPAVSNSVSFSFLKIRRQASFLFLS